MSSSDPVKMSSDIVRVAFTDFWKGFIPGSRIIDQYILSRPGVQLVSPESNPDLLVTSVFGGNQSVLQYKKLLLYSGENMNRWLLKDSDFLEFADYAIGTSVLSSLKCPSINPDIKYLYSPMANMDHNYECTPLDVVNEREENSRTREDWRSLILNKKRFCSFVFSNNLTVYELVPFRDDLFRELSKYKKVDSAGPNMNNMPQGELAPPGEAYNEFLEQYKFSICIENTKDDAVGYFTEKVPTAQKAHQVPIYYGHELNKKIVNPKAMIWANDINEAVKRIIELDTDIEKHIDLLMEDPYLIDPRDSNGILNRDPMFRFIDNVLDHVRGKEVLFEEQKDFSDVSDGETFVGDSKCELESKDLECKLKCELESKEREHKLKKHEELQVTKPEITKTKELEITKEFNSDVNLDLDINFETVETVNIKEAEVTSEPKMINTNHEQKDLTSDPKNLTSDSQEALQIPFLIISLSTREDNRERMKNRMKYHKIQNPIFIDGVTPKDKIFKEFTKDFVFTYDSQKSVAGCHIAHINACRYIVEHNLKEAVVDEDDVLYRNDFATEWPKVHKSIPKGTNLVLLTYIDVRISPEDGKSAPTLRQSTVGEYFAPIVSEWGAQSYWLTLEYAKEVLEKYDIPLIEYQRKGLLQTSEIIIQGSKGLFVTDPLVIEEPGIYSQVRERFSHNEIYFKIFGIERYLGAETKSYQEFLRARTLSAEEAHLALKDLPENGVPIASLDTFRKLKGGSTGNKKHRKPKHNNNKYTMVWLGDNQGTLWEIDWIKYVFGDLNINVIFDNIGVHFQDKTIIVTGDIEKERRYIENYVTMGFDYVLVNISDEYIQTRYLPDPRRKLVIRNCYNPIFDEDPSIITFGLGYKTGFWPKNYGGPKPRATTVLKRKYMWSFAGSITPLKIERKSMLEVLRKIKCASKEHISSGFNSVDNLSTDDYRKLLLQSVFIPSPTGNKSVDCFRTYEALEAGCIPITVKNTVWQPFDYYSRMFGEQVLWPQVEQWHEVVGIIELLIKDKKALETLRLKCYEQWISYKERMRKLVTSRVNEVM